MCFVYFGIFFLYSLGSTCNSYDYVKTSQPPRRTQSRNTQLDTQPYYSKVFPTENKLETAGGVKLSTLAARNLKQNWRLGAEESRKPRKKNEIGKQKLNPIFETERKESQVQTKSVPVEQEGCEAIIARIRELEKKIDRIADGSVRKTVAEDNAHSQDAGYTSDPEMAGTNENELVKPMPRLHLRRVPKRLYSHTKASSGKSVQLPNKPLPFITAKVG